MRVANEKLIINKLGPSLHGHNKQSGRSDLGLINFLQTKHAHEHLDLIIHIDIKTSNNESFSIIWHQTIYCLHQEHMHNFFNHLWEVGSNSQLVNPIMSQTPVPNWANRNLLCTRFLTHCIESRDGERPTVSLLFFLFMFHLNCLHILISTVRIGKHVATQEWSPRPILVAKFGPARTSFGKRGPSLTTKSGLGGKFSMAKIGPRDHFWVGPIFTCCRQTMQDLSVIWPPGHG